MDKKARKQIFLVNRDFQLRYVRLAVIVGIASTCLTLILVLYPLVQFRIIRFPVFLPLPFLAAILTAIGANIAIITWLGVHVTHRIAGPIFSLVRHMRHVELGGSFKGVKFRESDDLQYLARNYNSLMHALVAAEEARLAMLDRLEVSIKQSTGEHTASLLVIEELRQEFKRRT
ncbi:MAG: hypothetical protein FJ146_00700 [Deltaproteobacteria bacterium]|nr:hypothetical protein [Deltaproteobacteria bacterium]